MPDNYNPRGALGDLFAPAFIRGYQLVDINVLRAAAQGGQPAGRDAITHQPLASGGGTGTTGTGTTGTGIDNPAPSLPFYGSKEDYGRNLMVGPQTGGP